MKKIIIAFDGKHFSEGAFEFASRLNDLNPVLLTGVFLSSMDYAAMWSVTGGMGGPVYIPMPVETDMNAVEESIRRFEKRCRGNNIDYRIHKDTDGIALAELRKESRFADLMIISSELFFDDFGNHEPNDYLKDALHNAECPVILVPEAFDFPDNIILAYDGSESSVYAIKQFAYLFPELCCRETLLVYASNQLDGSFPDEIQMEELVSRHFNDLTLFKLDASPRKYFTNWLRDKKGTVLVAGAFGRSGLSELFKKSFITEVIKEHRTPVFIAHR
jgi:nucleotide-binding universal stress UspA family protein